MANLLQTRAKKEQHFAEHSARWFACKILIQQVYL